MGKMEKTKNKDVSFTPEEFEKVSKYLVGSLVRPFPNGRPLIPQTNGLAREQPIEEKRMQAVMESCPFKGVMSFVVGGALGAFLGLFSSSIAPHHTTTPMTTKETLIDMRKTIGSHSRNFAVIGLM